MADTLLDALTLAGAQMANACYNLRHRSGEVITPHIAETLGNLCKEWDAALAAIRAANANQTTGEFVLVPKEPTTAMLDAATPSRNEWIGHPEAKEDSITRWINAHRSKAQQVYKTMIAAAPQAVQADERAIRNAEKVGDQG